MCGYRTKQDNNCNCLNCLETDKMIRQKFITEPNLIIDQKVSFVKACIEKNRFIRE